MANLLNRTDRFAYLRVTMSRQLFEQLVGAAGGNTNRALATVRRHWEETLRRLQPPQ
jgi:hypothetical protein